MDKAKEIAEEFFDWQEKSQPLMNFWDLANKINRDGNAENYPYSYWKEISEKKIEDLIHEKYGG